MTTSVAPERFKHEQAIETITNPKLCNAIKYAQDVYKASQHAPKPQKNTHPCNL